jgi:hypothetical protein
VGPHPGEIRVYGRPANHPAVHRVVVTVADRGRWRPLPSDPGYRGRGLRMMRGWMDSVIIQPAAAGTTVIMTHAATLNTDHPHEDRIVARAAPADAAPTPPAAQATGRGPLERP